jgi:hypothetical protein
MSIECPEWHQNDAHVRRPGGQGTKARSQEDTNVSNIDREVQCM